MKWYKDGVLVTNGGLYDITTTLQNEQQQATSVLKVNPVSLGTAGVYSCNASNSFGTDSFATTVNVMCKLFVLGEIPPGDSHSQAGNPKLGCF